MSATDDIIKLRDEQLAEARRIIEFDIERVQTLEAQIAKERAAVDALIRELAKVEIARGYNWPHIGLAIAAVRKSRLPQPPTAADPEAVNEYVAQRWVWDASYKAGGYWDDWPTQTRSTLADAAACAHLIRTPPNPHRARVVHRTQDVVPESTWAPLALSDPRCRKPETP